MAWDSLFNAYDAVRSYQWLGHEGHGYTELLAIHPDYMSGRENYAQNVQNNAFPKVWYVEGEKQLVAFLSRYHGSHICCYGVNSRPEIIRNKGGYPKRASDDDIRVVQNFYLDFDVESGLLDRSKEKVLEDFIGSVDDYLSGEGLNSPARAFTGNGYHLLFALPAVDVEKHGDIGYRLDAFYQVIQDKFASDMASYGFKLDKTTDLSRVAKIYGTRKPGKVQLSRFYGAERVEDNSLLEYLLALPVEPSKKTSTRKAGLPVSTGSSLPEKFQRLLEENTELANLWNGTGKTSGDTSRSGYDMSLMHACIKHGITDIKDLATILALRENGSAQGIGKGDDYIRKTLISALGKAAW